MSENIIKVEQLSFRYPGAEAYSLQDISIEINKGDFVGIIGNNGSGKTTFCKAFNGLIPHFYSGSFEGKVVVNGFDTRYKKVAELSREVGYVCQDYERQLLHSTVFEDIAFAPANFGIAGYLKKVEDIIDILNLTSIKNEPIWQLSGGQKHLVALGSVLAVDPEIIIIDEPVAQLDSTHGENIYNKLEMLNRCFGKTIIVIEHHAEFIAKYCNHVILMHDSKLLWKKNVKQALTDVKTLIKNKFQPPQITMAAFHCIPWESDRVYPVTMEEGQAFFSNFKTHKSKKETSTTAIPESTDPIVQLENVNHTYKNFFSQGRTVLKNLNFSAFEGERIALLGRNGCGKSTVLKAIAGIIKPTAGKVSIYGKNIRGLMLEEVGEIAAYIGQNPESIFVHDNIRDDIAYFQKQRNYPNLIKSVDDILITFQLQHLQQLDGRLLSGGEQRRAALAIGIAMQPKVLLLDEPTSSLDFTSREDLFSHLFDLNKYVKTVILATHDIELVAEWATRILVLEEGYLIEDGEKNEVFNHSKGLHRTGLKEPQIVSLSRSLGFQPVCLGVKDFVSRFSLELLIGDEVNGVY